MRIRSSPSLSQSVVVSCSKTRPADLEPVACDQVQFRGKRHHDDEAMDALSSELLRAAKRRDTPSLKRLLEQGALPTQTDHAGITPLMATAFHGDLEALNALLEKGAPIINQQSSSGITALSSAVLGHQPQAAVAKLLKGSADPNIQDHNGQTPLSEAAIRGYTQIARLLLRYNANPEPTDAKTRLPLGEAAGAGQVEMARLLLNEQVNPNGRLLWEDTESCYHTDQSPLMLAAKHNQPAMIRLLVKNGAQPDLANKAGISPLALAVQNRHWESIQEIVTHTGHLAGVPKDDLYAYVQELASPNQSAQYGANQIERIAFLLEHGLDVSHAPDPLQQKLYQVLRSLARNNELDKAALFLEKGVKPDRKNSSTSPLLHAVLAGHLNMARLLLHSGASTATAWERVDGMSGMGSLQLAAKTGNEAMVRLLLNIGSDLEGTDSEGRTALTHAVENGHAQLVRILREEYGADLQWAFHEAETLITPLMAAAQHGNLEILEYLINDGIDVNAANVDGFTPLMSARNSLVAEQLRNAGADVNAQDASGFSVLHHQTIEDHPEVVNTLLRHGANPALKNHYGVDVVMKAAEFRRLAIIKRLLQANPLVQQRDKQNRTALIYAAGSLDDLGDPQTCERERVEILKTLLEFGADINATDKTGMSALKQAAQRHYPASVEFLLANGANPFVSNSPGHSPLSYAAKSLQKSYPWPEQGIKTLKTLIQASPEGAAESPELQALLKQQYARFQPATTQNAALLGRHIIYSHLASWEINFPNLKKLLDAGVSPGLAEKELVAILNQAIACGELEKASFLLEKRVNPNIPLAWGDSLLMRASQAKTAKASQLLLAHGADPNALNPVGASAFTMAADQGRFETMLCLLKAGAHPAPECVPEEPTEEAETHKKRFNASELAQTWPKLLQEPTIAQAVQNRLRRVKTSGSHFQRH